MKPGFHTTIAIWYLLKHLVSGSWWDECMMIDFKISSFTKLARILSPIDPKINSHLCLDMTYLPAKFDFDVNSNF